MNPHQGQFQKGQLVPGTSYRVEELIGTGGMGSVYRVEHAELGRRFVLKALHGHLASRQDLVARLKNEWRALGKLEHPNIVQVTDAGQTEQGLPYYVMEHLRGSTLAQLMMARKRLGAREACLLVVDILAGLHAAHETGAVHRDIKPPNIFVVEGGRAKLLDFGIAKLRDQSAKVVTAGGISIGTPRYMAPEQASGTVVDGRADIYATALVLYEMVVGKGPFSHIRDPNDLVMAHIGQEPERADFVDPRVPAELGDLIQRWLCKAPSSRPANAEFARRELLALAHSLPSDEQSVGEEVTVGGAYDASTMGAVAPLPEEREGRAVPSHGPRSSASTPSANENILRGESPEPAATISLIRDERTPATKPAEGARAGTLGFGTADAGADDESELGLAETLEKDHSPRPRRPSRRVSVTPPPVSSLRPGALESSRATLKWIGGTAVVSFLVALGISQVIKRPEVDPKGQGAPSALHAPAMASGKGGKAAAPVAETESAGGTETRTLAPDSLGAEHPDSSDGAQVGPSAEKALPPPPEEAPLPPKGADAGTSSTTGSGAVSHQTPAPAPRPAPSPASVKSPAKRSAGGRTSSPVSKVGDQLPESGLW